MIETALSSATSGLSLAAALLLGSFSLLMMQFVPAAARHRRLWTLAHYALTPMNLAACIVVLRQPAPSFSDPLQVYLTVWVVVALILMLGHQLGGDEHPQ